MNRFFLVVSLFLVTASYSQRPNFVYIQSEPAQAFTVKLGEQAYQSSQSGYLILSKLTDTVYQLVVSFPDTGWPEQYFTLNVNHTDKGYLLKDYGEKGWGLMDWRKLTVQYSIKPQQIGNTYSADTARTNEDDFASLLAKASGDPSLNKRIEKKESVAGKEATVSKEAAVIKEASVPIVLPPVVEKKAGIPASEVTRRAESSTNEGFGLVYIDKYANGQEDTIRLIIPNKTPLVSLPSYCKELATEDQVNTLKIGIAAQQSDNKRIELARPQLEARCYTVAHVKELVKLFSSDEGKYNFLLEAWSHVSDRAAYISLAVVFATKEATERFKEMVQ